MSTTFSTPIRIFKRNNPNNDGSIAPSNAGAVSASQQNYIAPITATTSGAVVLPLFKVGQTTASTLAIPAGSMITNVRFFETTSPSAITGGVITVQLLTTNPSTGVVTTTSIGTITPTTAGGVITATFTATAAVATLLNNVGTVDAEIRFSQATISAITGTLAGTFDVSYVARNPDGSLTPTGAGLSNS